MDKDSLQYKESCEKCDVALTWVSAAFACPNECTYCPECADELGRTCPNCSDDLRPRPKRTQPIRRGKG